VTLYDQWLAVLIAIAVGFVLVGTAIIASKLLGPYARERAKEVSYECGMLPVGRNWAQVHVRYYLIAILFLLFDVETVFIVPCAVTFVDMPEFVLYYMVAFIVILTLGLLYAWKRRVLEWQ
jgi:NADH-quinone oxidoreductase subunit A